VTLTAAGIAGFIISLGIAVDANILIFERIKEELRSGRTVADSITAGFERAWTSIRDSNISSLITATILFWFGTSLIQGFALTLGIGVLVSLFSSIVVTRVFMNTFGMMKEGKVSRFLFSSGITNGKSKK
jgi:protein-export membrane protein SecD